VSSGSTSPPDKAQRNFTDPDSRIMKGPDGFVQAYNAQAAVDAESQVIVAQHVTPQATDAAQFEPLVVQIKTNTGRQAAEVSADAGYCSEHNLRVAQQRHIRAYIATGRQRHGQASATNARRGRTSGLVTLRLPAWVGQLLYASNELDALPEAGQVGGATRVELQGQAVAKLCMAALSHAPAVRGARAGQSPRHARVAAPPDMSSRESTPRCSSRVREIRLPGSWRGRRVSVLWA